MTLVELQNILGRNVESIMNAKTGNEIEIAKYNATYVTLIAKQMINNADVVLRTEKLIAEGKLKKDNAISKIVGVQDGNAS